MPADFAIHQVEWEDMREQLLSVRLKVFIEEQGIDPALEIDTEDDSCLHFLARTSGNIPIGTARLTTGGQIGRVAVLPNRRREGVGSALMRAVMQGALESGQETVTIHAQKESIPFYRTLGFCPFGEEFEEAGIPHYEMICDLQEQQSSP